MRKIQKEVLPDDWLVLIEQFDIKSSSLSENNKIISTYLIEHIKSEKEKSLIDSLSKFLIRHIIFGEDFLT